MDYQMLNRRTLLGATAGLVAAASFAGDIPLGSNTAVAAVDPRLTNLLNWLLAAFNRSGNLQLLPDCPSATTFGGHANKHLSQLQQTYWLEDNCIYGEGALLQWAPTIGQALSASWRARFTQTFPKFCINTVGGPVIGVIPAFDGGPFGPCGLPKPGIWQKLKVYSYPDPSSPGFDHLPLPIIATDYPGQADGVTGTIQPLGSDPRDLFKYGCLRQVVLGNSTDASTMFDLGLASWDGNGFAHSGTPGVYHSRDLAFALICANALGRLANVYLDTAGKVARAAVEAALWKCQASDGGMWTNYTAGGRIGSLAKETCEIAPLVLLAYGNNIWAPPH
jgi:hypothetical protein